MSRRERAAPCACCCARRSPGVFSWHRMPTLRCRSCAYKQISYARGQVSRACLPPPLLSRSLSTAPSIGPRSARATFCAIRRSAPLPGGDAALLSTNHAPLTNSPQRGEGSPPLLAAKVRRRKSPESGYTRFLRSQPPRAHPSS